METAMCISQVSAHWEGFRLPLTFRITLEWGSQSTVHSLLTQLSILCGKPGHAFPFSLYWLLGAPYEAAVWVEADVLKLWAKCHGSMSHLLYNLLFLLTCVCLTLYVPFPFDHGILLCTSSLIIQQIMSHSVYDGWFVLHRHLVFSHGLVFSLFHGLAGI